MQIHCKYTTAIEFLSPLWLHILSWTIILQKIIHPEKTLAFAMPLSIIPFAPCMLGKYFSVSVLPLFAAFPDIPR